MTTTIVSGNTTSTETIVAVAARELAGKRRVFAGVGLPTLAVDLARHTSNPDVELIYESGVCGAHPSAMAEGIADSVVVSGAESVLSMAALFGYVLQGGDVDVGFLGAAQIDRTGSLNTSFIGDWKNPTVRLSCACRVVAARNETRQPTLAVNSDISSANVTIVTMLPTG